MNRILIGSSNNEVIVKKDEAFINVTKDTNFLIEDSVFKKYTFNIYNAKVNVLSILKNNNDITYEININQGDVSFNSISYTSSFIKQIVNLNKENSGILINNSVVAKQMAKYDIVVNHNKKLTCSNVLNNGVTKEDGTILFNVSSYVPKKSKGCMVNQSSKIITLNDTNHNEINPILLIDEFECEAKHSAFIGGFNNDKLFYLMSRGLNKEESINLLINGLLIGTLDICFNEREILRKKLNEEWR